MIARRHTEKKIIWNDETWTIVRAKGRCKWLRTNDIAILREEDGIIAFRAHAHHEKETKRIMHEVMHKIAGWENDSVSPQDEEKCTRATDLLIGFLIATGVDLTPITEGFK